MKRFRIAAASGVDSWRCRIRRFPAVI
jgi:hypothetical protein